MSQGPEELESFTPYLMNRIMARYNKGVEAELKSAGVSVAQMRALVVLADNGPCSISELSVLTVIKQSTLSRALDAMEKADLIKRESPADDSRIRLISLSDAGRAAYEAAWPAMLGTRETMLSALSDDERKTLNQLLLKVFYDIRHHDF